MVSSSFWQTWWFDGLIILLLGAVVVVGYRWYAKQVEIRNQELADLVNERTAEIEQRRQVAEVLREILLILNSNRSVEESLHYIVSQAARLTDAEDVIIFRHQKDDPMTIVATNPGGQIRYTPGEDLLALTEEWATKTLLEKQPLIIPDLNPYWSSHPLIKPSALGAHTALLGIPLFLGEDVIYGGLIMFYKQEREFSKEDLELGSAFADQAALAIANNRLQRQVEQAAVASERNRLARDLHDAVTQTLFSASLIAEALPALWEADQEEGKDLLEELRQLTRGALAEMRNLLLELRPVALRETALGDLLRQLAEAVTGRSGVPVEVTIENPVKLPETAHVALYRIAQESLNNVLKHARAKIITVKLTGYANGDGVKLIIKDDGRGFDPQDMSPERMGLSIIRERAQAIGADLVIDTKMGVGTIITADYKVSQKSETPELTAQRDERI